jgi:anti-sigma B factor antagonist
MTITTKTETGKVTLELEGRLDTNTSPQLEDELAAVFDPTVEMLELDFAQLDYISSAGLRVLLAAQKKMNRQGEMIIRNANDVIMEVFEVTGFVDILHVE